MSHSVQAQYNFIMLRIPQGSIILAPMVELTHRALREFIEAHWPGADFYWTEMASTKSFLAHAPFESFYLDTQPHPQKTIIQWYSTNMPDMIEAVTQHYETSVANGQVCAGYDINFACSAPHIERSGGGITWMKKPEAAITMVRELRSALPDIQLTAKLRLGYEEDFKNLVDFCIALAEAGLDAIILHPRFKHEKFKLRNHWDILHTITAAIKIPIIGNGDITSFEKAHLAFSTYKLHSIMIGREAVRRPWIFYLIKNKSTNSNFSMDIELETAALTYISYVQKFLPAAFHLSRIKRFFFYFCDNLKFGHHLRYAIQNAQSIESIQEHIKSYFCEVPEERIKYEK
mgnify:CR=1 FL=1